MTLEEFEKRGEEAYLVIFFEFLAKEVKRSFDDGERKKPSISLEGKNSIFKYLSLFPLLFFGFFFWRI